MMVPKKKLERVDMDGELDISNKDIKGSIDDVLVRGCILMDSKDLITKDARQNQKHFINTKLVDIIEYRQSRKWYVSISVVDIFFYIDDDDLLHESR